MHARFKEVPDLRDEGRRREDAVPVRGGVLGRSSWRRTRGEEEGDGQGQGYESEADSGQAWTEDEG